MRNPIDLLKKVNVNSLTEMLAQVGLDFEVERVPMKVDTILADGSRLDYPIDSHYALVRKDNYDHVSVVARTYGVVDYKHAFAFINPLMEAGSIRGLNGGAIGNGERAYLVFSANRSFGLGNVEVRNIFFLTSAHDGTGKIEVQFAPVADALGTVMPVGKPISIRHTSRVDAALGQAELTLKSLSTAWFSYEKNMRQMMGVSLSDADAQGFISTVIGENKDSTRADNIKQKIYDIYKSGLVSGFPALAGNVCGVMHAVAVWADQYKTLRESKKLDETSARIESRLRGPSAKDKALAYANALKLVEAFGEVDL